MAVIHSGNDSQQNAMPEPSVPSFEQLIQSHCIKNLHLFPNRRMRSSWHVKIHPLFDKRELHFPAVLEHAPQKVKVSLLQWAMLQKRRTHKQSPDFRHNKRALETTIRTYLERTTQRTKRTSRHTFTNAPTQGTRYALSEVFATVNNAYFDGALVARVRWGGVATKTSYQKTTTDGDGITWHSITIAGIYNHPDVPRFAIEAIMYHEMLHIHIPPRRQNGRRIVHGSDFTAAERRFRWYTEWREWEKRAVPDILLQLQHRRPVNKRR